MKGTKKLLINGEVVEAASGKTFETLDPSNGKVLAVVSEAGPEDVDKAVKAAAYGVRQRSLEKNECIGTQIASFIN